jgi:hypothetical protein
MAPNAMKAASMIRLIVLAGMAVLVATQTMNAPGQVGTLLAWACRWQQRGPLGVAHEEPK